MRNSRNPDLANRHIDYCLNILGVRVWKNACQLIARTDEDWTFIGPKWDLPVEIPANEQGLKGAGSDTFRLTAWQYEKEHPGSDITEVLSQRKDFDVALTQEKLPSLPRPASPRPPQDGSGI
jgi:hypothetical protein